MSRPDRVESPAGFQAERPWAGETPAAEAVQQAIVELARHGEPLLITGERGTGKRLAAAQIHQRSGLRAGPFAVLPCSGRPASQVERLLFGHDDPDLGWQPGLLEEDLRPFRLDGHAGLG